ncbi:M81 family metallopeptidase [Verrucomicrobiales bacterium BCK34]|nr:M81 family metallopeptidase [Verrucomicrobiales bacterium BCK34]
MRIGIVALLQESNTFVSGKTRLEHFERELLITGEAIRDTFLNAEHEVGGFFAGLEGERDFEAVPIFAARALPYGTIEASTFDELVERLLDGVRKAGPLDGILAAPHGATAAENHPDADGSWLTKLREQVGPDLPIIATLDPHGNLSPAMVAATDALIAYSTNPHLDQRETGLRAADLMKRTLRGEIRPTQAAAFPPLQINIQTQNTGEAPMNEFYGEADEIASKAETISHSIMLGFPYADVCEMGSSVIVVTNDDSALAGRLADKIADRMWERREQFDPEFIDVTAAVEHAGSSEGTSVLLDMGDNIGGGSPGDSTFILHELEANGIRSLVIIDDSGSVRFAEDTGIGERAEFSIGGKNDTLHGTPLNVVATVKSLHDGRFSESKARHGGITNFDQGRTAIIETDRGVTIMLTSRRTPPFSLAQLTNFGIAPTDYRAIVAKGVIAPIAAYAEIADRFIHVNTPGVTCADMRQLNFRNRRQPLFPFEK